MSATAPVELGNGTWEVEMWEIIFGSA
jgi:hypothetical protein